MKKIVLYVLTCICLLVITGCGGGSNKIESIVGNGLVAIKNGSEEKIVKYFGEEFFNNYFISAEDYDYEVPNFLERLSYYIIESTEGKNVGYVKVEITNVDSDIIIDKYLDITRNYPLLEWLSVEDQRKQIIKENNIIIDLIRDEDAKLTSSIVDIKLEKIDGKWIIIPNEEFNNALMGIAE